MSGHVFLEAAGGSRGATRRRRSAVQRGPGAARKLFAVVVSDVRGDETLGRAPPPLQIQLRHAGLFASHLSPMMN